MSSEYAPDSSAENVTVNQVQVALELCAAVCQQMIGRPAHQSATTVQHLPQLRRMVSGRSSALSPSPDVAASPADVRVLIVDELRLSRECLKAQLTEQHIESDCAWDLESLMSQANRADLDVVLLSVNTRDSDTLLNVSLHLNAHVRVVVFGLTEDKPSSVVSCSQAGVYGMHLMTESFEDLLDLIRHEPGVTKAACSPIVSEILLRDTCALVAMEIRTPQEPLPLLSPREKQILDLLEAGMSNQQIATRLSVTVHTVKNHVHKVLTKLGVSTRAEAVAFTRAGRLEKA